MRTDEVIAQADRLLQRAEEVNALRFGDFTLTSGKKSNFYFDGRLLSTDPESVHIITSVMLEILVKRDIHVFGGPAVGAVPIVGSMMLAAHTRRTDMRGFFVRSEAKSHGMGKQIEGHLRPNDEVAIYDDTVSTGGSIISTIEATREYGADVSCVMCVLHRHEPKSKRINQMGIDTFNILKISHGGKIEVDRETIAQWFG